MEKAETVLLSYFKAMERKKDAEIEKLEAEEAESMGWIEQYRTGSEDYRKEIADLKAENRRLKDILDYLQEQY